MNFKLLVIILLTIAFIWSLFLKIVEYSSANNKIPDNVSDIYDSETYKKWRNYHHEKVRLGILTCCMTFVIDIVMVGFNLYAWVAGMFLDNIYVGAIVVILFSELVSTVLLMPFEYYDTMCVEEKYGFNRSTKKTFFADQVKEFILGMILTIGLLCAFAAIHTALGDYVVILFAIIMMVAVLFIAFLAPVFTKIFNKFTPLEEGELKDKLTGLLEKNGYKVKTIDVMDASKRSTKSNAYFTGFGRMKTIVLYDTLVASMTPDEICAVFAHEMGHGLHKDTLRLQILNFFMVAAMAVILWLSVRYPVIYADFGFEGVNYGFASIMMTSVLSVLSPLFGLVSASVQKKAEYRADAQAVKEGYKDALAASLKKLSRENYSNLAPSKITVALEYSHPTLSQRLDAMEKLGSEGEK